MRSEMKLGSVLRDRVPLTIKRPLRLSVERLKDLAIRPCEGLIQRITYQRPYCTDFRWKRVHLGRGVSTMNAFFNVASGDIYVGDDTIFGYGCMLLTGRHEFEEGRRVLDRKDVPAAGYDIRIGSGCWIASGVIIIGGVTIGDHVVVAAGAVVTADVPSRAMVGGVPARVLNSPGEVRGELARVRMTDV
jgi:acetyltransferase-like isoleucine patch superfamily enzyme